MPKLKDNRSREGSRDARSDPLRLIAALLLALLVGSCVSLEPLAELNTELGTGRRLSIDGVGTYIEETGEGEPLILVHGFGGSVFSWRKIVPALAKSHRVIAVDLAGFGLSDRPRGTAAYQRRTQVDRLGRLLDELGLDSAHWAGHSYGGGLVTTLAARQPDRVRSLTLVASTAPEYAERRRGPGGWRVFAAPFVRGIALRPRFVRRALQRSVFSDDLVDDELVRNYLDRLRVEGAVDSYVGLTAPAPDPGDDRRVDIENIDIPVLLIWGERDMLIPLDVAHRAVHRFPRARLVVLPECGHIPMEERPESVAREMLSFLNEPAAPPPGSAP